MRLTELEPEWCMHRENGIGHPGEINLANAQGVMFLDPVEFQKNGGSVGTSSVLVWFRGRDVPDDANPGPGRWNVSGTGFDDLTLSPSVDLTCGGKHPGRWHGWVQCGEVT